LVSASDLSGVRPGEVLVTRFASPEVVLAFDRIGALVTDQGGRSAHAAVVARELGIPAVVGTQEATQVVASGDLVAIDGAAGTVRILGG
jgi:phosphohistidine swiveling domain-containing protein